MQLQILPIQKTEIQTDKYQLDSSKLSQIEQSFSVKVQEGEMLLNQYSAIVEKEITPEVVEEARELGKKLVKVRTGIAAIHKAEKEVYLKAGQYCDTLKNKYTLFVEQMEDNLKKIVSYFDDLEKQKLELKRAERWFELSEFTENEPPGLDTMTDDMYEIIKAGIIAKFEKDKAEAALNKVGQDRFNELLNYRDYLNEVFTVDQLKVMPESEYLSNLSIAKLEKQNAIEFKAKTDKRTLEIQPYLSHLKEMNLKAVLESSDKEYVQTLKELAKRSQQAEKTAKTVQNEVISQIEKTSCEFAEYVCSKFEFFDSTDNGPIYISKDGKIKDSINNIFKNWYNGQTTA